MTLRLSALYNKDMTNQPMTDSALADLYARRNDRQVYACEVKTKPRLSKVTFCLGEPPMRDLLWCDKRKGR